MGTAPTGTDCVFRVPLVFESQPVQGSGMAYSCAESEKTPSSLQILTLVHVLPLRRVLLSICKYLFWSGYSARKCFYDGRRLHRHPLLRHLRALEGVPLSIGLYNKLAHSSCGERSLLKKEEKGCGGNTKSKNKKIK